MVDFCRPGYINNVIVCYNGNRQIPMYVHSSNYTRASLSVNAWHCISTRGIAFCSAFDTPGAIHVFHACPIALVANLYRM